ncbi:N,N-dimethylformamidase beta subunit family domain-containing protein [Nocardia fusca]|uniref:N,N-dimethylformamidase beta subunit family domain-containing protein n=1 Tax=Nocardia fusca TaxID=941183 RepID=UPI0007A7313D|nr:N,N-dimethylformamidase beta subunit family domain-containing protein [Nocardia fusca]
MIRYEFDVITDEEIHRDGLDALNPYRVVLTSSHPEYPTTPMMAAYESYLADGEWHHATTGELGGLWRLRGKEPQVNGGATTFRS